MKKIEKLINEVEKMLEESNRQANQSAMGFDEGHAVGKVEALEEVLVLLKANQK